MRIVEGTDMKKTVATVLAVILILSVATCVYGEASQKQSSTAQQSVTYSYTDYPLERNGIHLHLDCMAAEGTKPDRNILLIHGVTYSSHEFDIDYEDYSLVRFLAREGYAVWRLDIAGFGQSEEVEDGFLPDSD